MLTALLLLASARCTFPDYDIVRASGQGGGGAAAGAAGSVGDSGMSGSVGGGTGGAAAPSGGGALDVQGGSDGTSAGAGGTDEVVGGAGCVGDQWPVERCEASGCLQRYPQYCYDGELSGDEVDVDCGGSCQACTNEACEKASDCLSGSCEASSSAASCYAPLGISFVTHDTSPSVDSVNFKLRLTNGAPADGQTFSLPDLKIRYYFKRSGVVEPLLVRAPQADLFVDTGSRTLSKTTWTIERVEPVAGAAYDAYLEIGFGDSGRLGSGQRIEIAQQLVTGWVGHSNFDQHDNYSFPTSTPATADSALHVTVHYRGQLLWGLEPAPADPRACFARGVNLNGPALTVHGADWQAAADANVTTTGTPATPSATPSPAVDEALAKMLGTATRLEAGKQLELPLENASYLVYLYANSLATESSPGVFTLQGSVPAGSEGFRAQLVDGSRAAWARLGPFRVDVTTGKLSLAVTQGAIHFTGIELWYPE